MPKYTLFLLDWDDVTVEVHDIECPDDETALGIALVQKGDHADVEVLCGSRTVGRPRLKEGHGRVLRGTTGDVDMATKEPGGPPWETAKGEATLHP